MLETTMEILLSCCLHEPKYKSLMFIPRFNQRLSLIEAWQIESGQRLLDIGCGQGESCLALALTVGESGHVTGVDPNIDYGSPFTVRQSHEYISKSVLAPRITFAHEETEPYLRSLDQSPGSLYDAAVLSNSLWYFANHDSVFALFHTLATGGIRRLYIAENSFQPSSEHQVPHVLAARAQALYYAHRAPKPPGSLEQNIRAALDQASIINAARQAGFHVHQQGIMTPHEDQIEGHLEVKYVNGALFRKRVEDEHIPADQEEEIFSYAVRAKDALDKLAEKGVQSGRHMDVWWAVLDLDG